MIKTITSIFVGVITSLPLMSQHSVHQTSFGKGLLNYVASDSSFSVKFAPRMQARYELETILFSLEGLVLSSTDGL